MQKEKIKSQNANKQGQIKPINNQKQKYRCKKCRKQLFTQILHGVIQCTSYFIDQPQWLKVDDLQNEIKFNCPKCNTKLGEVIFSGKKCSCGKWITPAYQVLKNKVDFFKKLGI